ncbi:MAG: transaldolase family protein [Oscillospiraceae bacterium]
MKGYFHRVSSRTPTDFWINNVTLREAELAIEAGAAGCTQNPSFVWRILSGSEDQAMAEEILERLMRENADNNAVLSKLQAELIGQICRKFFPLFERSRGKQGWVSIQGDPFHEDSDTIVAYGRQCRALAENVIVKIPATLSGLAAIEQLLPEGTPILATEVMSLDQAAAVCDLYDRCAEKMANPPTVYMAQIAGIFDEHLRDVAKENGIEADPELFFTAGTAVAKKVRRMMADRRSGVKFMSGGARGTYHFTELVGVDGCVTINWDGYAKRLLEENPAVIQRFHMAPDPALIDELLQSFPAFRKAYTPDSLRPEEFESFGPVVKFRLAFESGWRSGLDYIAQRRNAM